MHEPVQAVIDDGTKPLMTVTLSDTSTLSVTTNHPFSVDASSVRPQPGWVAAGDLKLGDHLRTASGQDVPITKLQYGQGTAHVYTLTIAHDHTFFVGHARVLVHNATPSQILRCNLANAGIQPPARSDYEAHHIVPSGAYGRRSLVAQQALQNAQDILQRAGINPNSADNGVWLPGPDMQPPYPEASHRPIHTDNYFRNINNLLRQAVLANGTVDPVLVKNILQDIANRLRANDATLYQ